MDIPPLQKFQVYQKCRYWTLSGYCLRVGFPLHKPSIRFKNRWVVSILGTWSVWWTFQTKKVPEAHLETLARQHLKVPSGFEVTKGKSGRKWFESKKNPTDPWNRPQVSQNTNMTEFPSSTGSSWVCLPPGSSTVRGLFELSQTSGG